jgi:phytoene synthase
VVPARRKAVLLTRALAAAPLPAWSVAVPPLEETRFLVEAVSTVPAPAASETRGRIEDRVIWLLDLFERLERRQRDFEAVQPRVPGTG